MNTVYQRVSFVIARGELEKLPHGKNCHGERKLGNPLKPAESIASGSEMATQPGTYGPIDKGDRLLTNGGLSGGNESEVQS